jgi:regulator of RNase E activity RraA
MPTSPLTTAQLEELRRYNTPTISNAIEIFNIRQRHLGFLPHQIRAMFPDLGPIVGYAVTSQTRAMFSPDPWADLTDDYYRYVAGQPGPKVAVGQDLDDPPGLGAQFGEVNATLHKRLGCVGHVTSGCPRDLDEVHALGFAMFGLNPCVSHAYVRIVDFGKPVKLGDVEILPGELIHADKHGVCIIPREVAPKLAAACAAVEQMERPLLEVCRSPDFTLDKYLELRKAAIEQMKQSSPTFTGVGLL